MILTYSTRKSLDQGGLRFGIDTAGNAILLREMRRPRPTQHYVCHFGSCVEYFSRICYWRDPAQAIRRHDQENFRDKFRQADWTPRITFCCQSCSDCKELHACLDVRLHSSQPVTELSRVLFAPECNMRTRAYRLLTLLLYSQNACSFTAESYSMILRST